MYLNELKAGERAVVRSVGGEGALRQHFLDMGVIPGAEITLVKFAPMGDPIEFRIHEYELTLRIDDAKQIGIEKLPSWESDQHPAVHIPHEPTDHPGLGEGGRYHVRQGEHPLPDSQLLTFALAGNQNCGKTTLFNQLTGSNQHVGNFPGVTVDQKSGSIRGHANTKITDLPGIYSMSPYTEEEIVSREFILREQPTGIINIVDATNIERNLYLTLQLIELDRPMVLALNMMDELTGNGGSVDINAMESLLGIPVVPISAAKGEGIEELVAHALHVAHYQEKPGRMDFCDAESHRGAVHRCLHGIMHLIEDHAKEARIPVRFAATKIVEGDSHVIEALMLDQNEMEMIEHIICQMEKERGLDRSAAIADMRFSFIGKLVDRTFHKAHESRQHERSRRIDKILTGKYTAIPAFIAIMSLVFYLTFNVIGAALQDLMAAAIAFLQDEADSAMTAAGVNEAMHSLVIDGIFQGVGTVLSFLPIIVTLFFFLSLLEDTGYMARIAFVMDKWLRRIGLSGRSIVPLLIGFGCSVPAIMSTRTLPSERDRRMTILLTPFMSCSAKLPIYGFFIAAFFGDYGALPMIVLYFGAMLVGILMAYLGKNTIFKGEAVPFVMELPNYRMPGRRNVMQLLWEKSKDFLERAFSVIFIATIVIWFLQTFDFRLDMVADSSESMLASIAGVIAPVFAPLGFGDWRISTALISGFMAKESVVSTLGVLFGTSSISTVLTPLAAASLLAFCLLYTPCVAAITSVKRELGTKWAIWVVIFQCVIAWIVAFIVHTIGMLL
ncbi:ferrous iron transport protein B [Mitsuokella jalaludinii]|uniref:ferrous iron transport protein B n=1 Tax=Mitsuokella jalaludinii TaxID=187979 RepID=UPI00242C7369|nr:ferrous iron transport protein B [Mitsuokella jalaludinii]MCI6612234.1 ferrous iron transport protein B [Mitsuokella jalaludinii]MDD7745547.1 ferrous iron transport protein B [Mitsuokella jalaludinii]MDY5364774.1 ferrous iron transport protein B [Mitsuokella jalaludinii]